MVLITDYTPRILKFTSIREQLLLELWTLQLNILDMEEKKKVEDARKVEKVLKRLLEQHNLKAYEDKEGRIGIIPPDAGSSIDKYILDPAALLMIKTGGVEAITRILQGGKTGETSPSLSHPDAKGISSHPKGNPAVESQSNIQGESGHDVGGLDTSKGSLPSYVLEERYPFLHEKVCKECGKPTKSHQDSEGYYHCHSCFQKMHPRKD